MPLWFFAGFVDDADQHSPKAYNQTRALAGYNIEITGTDGYTTTVLSKDIIRSSNYIVANSLDGTHIADSDENWPLRFTGANVTGSMTVKGVKSIRLVPTGSIEVTSTPSGAEIFIDGKDTARVTPHSLTAVSVGSHNIDVTLSGYVNPPTRTVHVVKDQTVSAEFTLVRESGSISVTSIPAGAEIFLNGTDTTHVTPYTLTNVPVGSHNIDVTLSGYVNPPTGTVQVVKDQTVSR